MDISHTDKGLATDIAVGLAHGIHARPAAKLAQAAREFEANITISSEDAEVNAKSMLDILSLALSKDDRVRVAASGPDAMQAIKKISSLITGSGD